MTNRVEFVLSFESGDPDVVHINEALERGGVDTSGLTIIKREGPELAEYLRSDAELVSTYSGGDES